MTTTQPVTVIVPQLRPYPLPPEPPSRKVYEKEEKKSRWKWYFLALLLTACVVLPIVYFNLHLSECVQYIDGTRNITLTTSEWPLNKDCILNINQTQSANQTLEVREIKTYARPHVVLIAFGACLGFLALIIMCKLTPCNIGNYRSCYRRTTCCCNSTNLRDSINRYMNGYISNEAHFRRIVESGREGLDMIVAKLKYQVPEFTYDVLMTGSLQERLGKPNILKQKKLESLPIKSPLSSDFDVMLVPQSVMASSAQDCRARPTLFEVVTLSGLPTGFVWLKLCQNLPEARNVFWQNLCQQFIFSDGSNGVFLSSHAVRQKFVMGMKEIKHGEENDCLGSSDIKYCVTPQGPAVTVIVESVNDCLCSPCMFCPPKICKSLLFYGDFIFAIRCIGWPQEAREWPYRQRYWPTPTVIQEIMTLGYHVVPKPCNRVQQLNTIPGQSALAKEWRISYSMAELILSRHIPPVARACLLALKATLKRHHNEIHSSFSSYHLKTALFWALELYPPDFWYPNRIEECFMNLVDLLLQCAETNNLCHYFMPQVNLINFPGGPLGAFLTKIKDNPVDYLSSKSLRCTSNVAACLECVCFSHGDDALMDVY